MLGEAALQGAAFFGHRLGGPGQCLLHAGVALIDRCQQRGRALLEGVGKGGERLLEPLAEPVTAVLVAGERRAPGIRDVRNRGVEASGESVELSLYGVRDPLLKRRGLLGDAAHRGLDRRADGLAREAGAVGEALPRESPTELANCAYMFLVSL